MAKKLGFNPFVILTAPPQPTDVIVIGGGTGEGASDPVPCSYTTWVDSAWTDGYDYDQDGVFSEEEYAYWWEDCGFTKADWEELNPTLPWDDYFG